MYKEYLQEVRNRQTSLEQITDYAWSVTNIFRKVQLGSFSFPIHPNGLTSGESWLLKQLAYIMPLNWVSLAVHCFTGDQGKMFRQNYDKITGSLRKSSR